MCLSTPTKPTTTATTATACASSSCAQNNSSECDSTNKNSNNNHNKSTDNCSSSNSNSSCCCTNNNNRDCNGNNFNCSCSSNSSCSKTINECSNGHISCDITNGNNVIVPQQQQQQQQQQQSSSIKYRKPNHTTTTTTSSSSIIPNNNNNNKSKDEGCASTPSNGLLDNLGYKEENAVYKEIPQAEELKRQHRQELMLQQQQQQQQHHHSNKNEYDIGYEPKIRWPDLMAQLFLHVGGLYGFYLLFSAKFYTFLWVVLTIWASGIGITAGVHRLWSHKSYTASLPLRILLVFLFTITGQRDAYTWALDHRIHHKFSETEADPHNAKRGFFFAHVGWLFLTAHPKVEEKRKVIDMSDLENDGVVMFQRKFYIPLFALCSIALPVLVPWYYWQEDLWMSFWINFNMRFCCTLNIAFFVNSVAHMWGRKPYDKNISPVESPIVSFMALGEGWHNYHHVFPWDYKTSEFGTYKLNVTTGFIDFCAKLGLATARKSVSPDMVQRRALKCGDGTRFLSDEFAHKDQVWGFGDKDLAKEDADELAKMRN